jgi:hypothetical protein
LENSVSEAVHASVANPVCDFVCGAIWDFVFDSVSQSPYIPVINHIVYSLLKHDT